MNNNKHYNNSRLLRFKKRKKKENKFSSTEEYIQNDKTKEQEHVKENNNDEMENKETRKRKRTESFGRNGRNTACKYYILDPSEYCDGCKRKGRKCLTPKPKKDLKTIMDELKIQLKEKNNPYNEKKDIEEIINQTVTTITKKRSDAHVNISYNKENNFDYQQNFKDIEKKLQEIENDNLFFYIIEKEIIRRIPKLKENIKATIKRFIRTKNKDHVDDDNNESDDDVNSKSSFTSEE